MQESTWTLTYSTIKWNSSIFPRCWFFASGSFVWDLTICISWAQTIYKLWSLHSEETPDLVISLQSFHGRPCPHNVQCLLSLPLTHKTWSRWLLIWNEFDMIDYFRCQPVLEKLSVLWAQSLSPNDNQPHEKMIIRWTKVYLRSIPSIFILCEYTQSLPLPQLMQYHIRVRLYLTARVRDRVQPLKCSDL